MATLTLRPNGAGAYTQLTASAGSNYTCVDETTPNDGVDYVGSTDSTQYLWDTYALENHTSEVGTINSVTVYFRCFKATGTANAKPRIRLNSTDVDGTAVTVDGISWTTYSEILARPGGGTWSWTDIDALEAGQGLKAGSSGYARCTWLYIVVDYTLPLGNQIFWMI